MFTRTALASWCGCVLVLAAVQVGRAEVSGAETLHVYGSEGPSPAMQEAAMAFEDAYDVKVEVISGPVSQWIEKAQTDADIIYCSAEFMMSELIHGGKLQINPATVTPLYLRPSAILVRPGNPKGVHDLPDLLRPGVRVMVVTGSGQTGLWEDMAGRQGDARAVRTFRSNVVLFAANSDEAQRAWKERSDIDAWVTWNIWYLPLHNHADMIPVSKDFVIYRQSNVALTGRGESKVAASRFLDFLTSPDGASIFKSWDWITEPADAEPISVESDVTVVCRIDEDVAQEGVGRGLLRLRNLMSDYESAGIPNGQVRVVAVVHDDAAYWMLDDAAYGRQVGRKTPNPNKALIEELAGMGVRIELCATAISENGWKPEDLLPSVRLVPGCYPRIVDLQLQGYAYLHL
ncbi:MAG: substrate-binding domain-containing protein [Phycisphaerales bacterium]|nr:substrate-binding domain-containing protein [Phycisphaerales bacterium]